MKGKSLRQLLCCLSDGQIHSGESLGAQLGVSRAAIWKQMRQAQERGLPVLAHKGSGYQLPMSMDWLEGETIRHGLQQEVCSILSDVTVLFEVDSTNNYALKLFREGYSTVPFALLAEQQSAGRGRRGRSWFSPFGCSIYMTLGWKYTRGLAAIEGLSLVVGLKLLQALQKLGIEGLALKWPNDVMWQRHKLAGILVDLQGDPAGECQVAIGIGLNVHIPAGLIDHQLPPIEQPWVDLKTILQQAGREPPPRNLLAASLLNELVPALQNMERDGFAAYQRDWQRHDYCFQKMLTVQMGTGWLDGRGGGVNSQGAYQIDTGQGRQTVTGGEISLRMQAGGVDSVNP